MGAGGRLLLGVHPASWLVPQEGGEVGGATEPHAARGTEQVRAGHGPPVMWDLGGRWGYCRRPAGTGRNSAARRCCREAVSPCSGPTAAPTPGAPTWLGGDWPWPESPRSQRGAHPTAQWSGPVWVGAVSMPVRGPLCPQHELIYFPKTPSLLEHLVIPTPPPPPPPSIAPGPPTCCTGPHPGARCAWRGAAPSSCRRTPQASR